MGTRGDVLEVEPGGRLSADQELPLRQGQVRLFEDVLEKPDLLEQARRTRLQHLATELAIEGGVPFEDDHLDPALREEQPEQEPCRASADDADVRARGRPPAPVISHGTRLPDGDGRRPLLKDCGERQSCCGP
jgi:hypothetical protein